MKLYEIRWDIEECLTIENDEEELDTERLDSLVESFDEKVGSCIAVLKNMKATEEAIATEIRRLQSQKRTIVNNQTRLKGYLTGEMRLLGRNKIQVGVHKCTVAKSPMSVIVENPETLPEEFQNVKVEARISAVINHIKETGEVFEGVIVQDNKYHLRVR